MVRIPFWKIQPPLQALEISVKEPFPFGVLIEAHVPLSTNFHALP
jgi:hypothetical protein